MKSLLNKDFQYTPVKAMGPDYLKRRFAAIRREQRKTAEREQANALEAAAKAVPIKRAVAK